MLITSGLSVCVVAALITACSSSAKSSSPGSSASSATKAAGSSTANGTPIVIGSIESATGASASSLSTGPAALNAWVSSVNASGGVNGHPLRLIVKEDNDRPAAGLAEAEALIHDHVVALLFDSSNTDLVWAPAIEKAGIPVLGGEPSGLSLTDPLFFPQQTTEQNFEYGQLYALKLGGATKMGVVYCAESGTCAEAISLTKKTAPELPVQFVWSGSVALASPDLTPQCLAARDHGVTGVEFATPADEAIKFAEACNTQGWHPVYGGAGATVTDDMLKVPALNNFESVQGLVPWFDNSTPALQAFHAAMSKYAPGTEVNSAAEQAWVSGQLFQAAAAASDSSPVTTSSLIAGLYKLRNDKLGGLAPPLTFTKGTETNIKCFFVVGIQDGKYSEPIGLKSVCAP
jgi:branched-chain amino acid transport system substrate-binding protein